MATTVAKLDVNIAWWVRPYLWCLWVVCFAIAPFLDDDDPTADRLVEIHAAFICRFGIRCTVS